MTHRNVTVVSAALLAAFLFALTQASAVTTHQRVLLLFGKNGNGGGNTPFSQSYITTLDSASGCSLASNVLTCSGASIGAADPTRRVAVGINSRLNAAAGLSISSATIGGIAAEIDIDKFISDTNEDQSAIISALVPSGATAAITVTFNVAPLRASASIYRIVGTGNILRTTGFNNVTNASPCIFNITAPSGNGVIYEGNFTGGTASSAQPPLTQDFAGVIAGSAEWIISASGVSTGSGTLNAGATAGSITNTVCVGASFF